MYGKWTRVSHTEKTHKTLLASVRFGSALSAPPHCGQRRGHSCLLPDSELLLWDPDVISYFRSRADCNHLHTSIMSDVLKRDRGNVECVLCGRARQKKKKITLYWAVKSTLSSNRRLNPRHSPGPNGVCVYVYVYVFHSISTAPWVCSPMEDSLCYDVLMAQLPACLDLS